MGCKAQLPAQLYSLFVLIRLVAARFYAILVNIQTHTDRQRDSF